MPKIPDYTQLRRDVTQARAGVDTRGVGANIGEGLMNVAQVTSEIHQNKMDEEVSGADVEMYTHLVGAVNSFDEDDEFDTMRQRFDGDVTGKLGEVASKISDPSRREKFVNKYKKDIASYGEQVSNQAWGKKVDFKKSELLTNLDNIRNSALNDADPTALGKANEMYMSQIGSARKLNYISETEGASLIKRMRDDTAKAHVQMLPVEERLAALKQLKGQLPPDELVALKNATNDELRIGKAQDIVQGMEERGIDWADSRQEIKKIKNPDLRKEVEARRDYAFARRDRAVTEGRTELKDKWFDELALGESRVEDIKAAGEWDAMGADLQREMITAQKRSVQSTSIPFSFAHHDNLYQLKVQAERGDKNAALKLREYVLSNYSSMSPAQQKTWSSVSIDGFVPPEVDSGLSDIQAISARLPKNSDSEKRRVMLGEMGKWREGFITRFGKEPTTADRENEIDRIFLEYDKGFFGIDTPFYDMTEDERIETTSDMIEKNPEAWRMTQEFFVKQGYIPSRQEKMQVLKGFIDGTE